MWTASSSMLIGTVNWQGSCMKALLLNGLSISRLVGADELMTEANNDRSMPLLGGMDPQRATSAEAQCKEEEGEGEEEAAVEERNRMMQGLFTGTHWSGSAAVAAEPDPRPLPRCHLPAARRRDPRRRPLLRPTLPRPQHHHQRRLKSTWVGIHTRRIKLRRSVIRGYYLDAISRLPTAELRTTTLARGLLVGGHCYGPLHPVHNIIITSVCYAAAFPTTGIDDLHHVLNTKGLDRAVRRSLDGLLTCVRHLSPDDDDDEDAVLFHLTISRTDLRALILRRAAEPEEAKATCFLVAAEAARHTNPAIALAFFASSVLPAVERDVVQLLLRKPPRLSSPDLERLSALLLPCPLPSCRPPPDPSPMINQVIADRRRGLTKWCECLLRVADVALRKFADQTGVHCQLHTIYGGASLPQDYCNNCYQEYFHINFMAIPTSASASDCGGGQSQEPLLCFFAEMLRPPRHDFCQEDITVCCLLETSPTRDTGNCLGCLMDQRKIDHPAVVRFGGQCYEIDKIEHDWDFPTPLDVDFLFFDAERDTIW